MEKLYKKLIKKKKKGFTLIELLAIIVILAIIMVVTIPTVLGSVADARRKTFQNSVNVVADWMEKQYALTQLYDKTDTNNVNEDYLEFCHDYAPIFYTNGCLDSVELQLDNPDAAIANTAKNFLKASGVKLDNYSKGYVSIDQQTKKACVKLYAKTNGDFGNVKPEINDPQGKNGLYFADASGYAPSGYADGLIIYMQSSGC